MTALIDDLGVWVQLGTIQPSWNWVRFPISTSTKNTIFRVSTVGNFDKINTFLYLRVLYENSGTNNPSSKWLKVYPKSESEILELDTEPLFLLNNISRIIEVRKSSRYGGYKRPITDSLYNFKLEEFIPFEGVVENASSIPEIAEAVNQVIAEVSGDLSQQIADKILQSISGTTNITSLL